MAGEILFSLLSTWVAGGIRRGGCRQPARYLDPLKESEQSVWMLREARVGPPRLNFFLNLPCAWGKSICARAAEGACGQFPKSAVFDFARYHMNRSFSAYCRR